jgi:hypothetical protein
MEKMRKGPGLAGLEKRLKKWLPISADKSGEDTQGDSNGL